MSAIKVLYAEDEIFLGKIVKETLESRGFEVVMVTDGAAVLSAFTSSAPDVCVLDVMLPGRNGFELATDIRAINDDIPIIFLTAKTQTEDLIKGFRTGGNDYIRKPFSMEELIIRIENVLRIRRSGPSAAPAAETIAIGRYTFHTHRQVLAYPHPPGLDHPLHQPLLDHTPHRLPANQPLHQPLTEGDYERKLSYRESELLKQLWIGRDHIIPREDILRAIWGNDSFLNSRNLDVYITKLRSYLRYDSRIEILTIKGVGYRFVLP
ncbi:MAG: response regulator transcription factor [Bacteroidetes bacterium]|nr:response regulator transcription factor [Bacteroidota bacterium]